MKIDNRGPLAVAALPLYGPGDRAGLVVVVKGTFTMPASGVAALAPGQRPVAFGDEPAGEDVPGVARFESDVVPFKPKADVILVGRAHAPGGRAVPVLDAALTVGTLARSVRVFGDRQWNPPSLISAATPTPPVPFTTMDLGYERAFGGIDLKGGDYCRENPVGRGFLAEGKKTKERLEGVRLPNLEDPQHPVRTPDDRPRPVGFGCYGRAWAPRAALLGTYDKAWRTTRAPLPPRDFRWEFHNAAHPDLQIAGYLRGDEAVELVNLSPGGLLRFRLPGIAPRVVVATGRIEDRGRGPFSETPLAMVLDTLVLEPDEGRLSLVWRGFFPTADLTVAEVEAVVIS